MFRKLLIGVAALAGLGFASSAQAVVFTVEDFTGDDATASITVEEVTDGDLQFTASLTGGTTGDIRAVWFNVDDSIDLTSLSVTGTDVTGFGTSIDPDADLTPKSFDFGVLIGAAGNDNITSTIFTVASSDGDLSISSFFEAINGDVLGLRLKSTAGPNGSSKLAGGFPPDGNEPPPTEVPEPGMLLLFGTGLLALGLARRIRAA